MESRCVRCESQFVKKQDKSRFCSHECWYAFRHESSTVEKVCRWCSATFRVTKSRQRKKPHNFCCSECMLRYKSAHAKNPLSRIRHRCSVCDRWTESKGNVCGKCKVGIAHVRQLFRWLREDIRRLLSCGKTCRECGKTLTGLKSVYCSKSCSWRHNRRNRRARVNNAWVESIELFDVAERDGWVCHICGEHVGHDADYKWQATLDHVVPLSRGGLHSHDNVKLAHFTCNSVKHDRMEADIDRVPLPSDEGDVLDGDSIQRMIRSIRRTVLMNGW